MGHGTGLERLFQTGRPERGRAWAKALIAELSATPLAICDPQIEQGPDNFYYLGQALGEGADAAVFDDVLPFCTEQAHCGLVLFRDVTRAGDPEWVFSLGDLWSIRMFGSIDGDPDDLAESEPEAPAEAESREILLAAPSESFLPEAMKEALGNFVKDALDLPDAPDVALMVAPNLRPTRILMLKVRTAAFRDAAHRDAVLHAAGWFLPRHRGVMFMPDGWED